MKINLNKIVIAAGICALATVAMAQDQTENAQVSAQHFVWEAATTDMKEINAGELALQKSDNADVKSFAKKIVADHKKAAKKLKSIADKKGLEFPDTNSIAMMGDRWHTNNWNGRSNWNTNSTNGMSPYPDIERGNHNFGLTNSSQMDAREMDFTILSGAEFDRAFASHMVKGHENAIAKFEAASAGLQDSDLKSYADKTLPTLREHLRMAQELQSKVGAWPASGQTNAMYQNR